LRRPTLEGGGKDRDRPSGEEVVDATWAGSGHNRRDSKIKESGLRVLGEEVHTFALAKKGGKAAARLSTYWWS